MAQNKNTLPWLPICPSSNSHNVKPVFNLINISRLGNNAPEGQEPCLAGSGAASSSGCWHHSLEIQHTVQTSTPKALQNGMALLAPFQHSEPKGSKLLNVTKELGASQSGLDVWGKLLIVTWLSWALMECWVTFWPLLTRCQRSLQLWQAKCLQTLLNVTWGDKITPNWKLLWKWNQWHCTLFFSNKDVWSFSTVTWCHLQSMPGHLHSYRRDLCIPWVASKTHPLNTNHYKQ